MQLLPDSRVGPVANALVCRHLEIEAADSRRTHAEQCETALVIAVDQLLARWRDACEDAEPGEGILALVCGKHPCRNALSRHAVKAVTPRDDVALDRVARPVEQEA